MKVLFIVRSTLFTATGGDTIQVIETARQLEGLGVVVDIRQAQQKMNYADYDFLHFFNITRPANMLIHIEKSKKPFVLSSILVDYSLYDKRHRKGLAGWVFKRMTGDGIEYLKNLYRFFMAKDKLVSFSYLWKGQRKSIREILKKTICVLVQSEEDTIC